MKPAGRWLTRPAAGMAVATGLSRASGLVRTVALAAALGVGTVSDAYNTANTAPNMIFTLVAGGALSAAVVPLLVQEEERRTEAASALLGVTLLVGAVVSVVVAVAAPWIFAGLTLGARNRPGYDAYAGLGASWLRMFAPQVGLYALSVLAVAVMTARRRLVLGAAAPVATNLVTMVAALAFVALSRSRPGVPTDVTASGRAMLGWGTTVAVAAMAAIQLWGASRSEPGLRPRLRLRDPAVGRLARIGGWVVLYVLVNQVGLAAVVAVANTVAGGVTAYQWGFMVMQLPYALIGVSVMSSSLAGMAGAADRVARTAAVVPPARTTLTWLVPAAAGLGLLARPVATVVVGTQGAALVGAAVVGFAASLVPFSLFQLLTRTSYAAGDSRGPAVVNVAVNVTNVAAALAAVALLSSPAQRVTGLAVSHALSYVVGNIVLGRRLVRRELLELRPIFAGLRDVVAASTVMALAVVAAQWPAPAPGSRAAALAVTGCLAGVGLAVYLVAGRLLRVRLAP